MHLHKSADKIKSYASKAQLTIYSAGHQSTRINRPLQGLRPKTRTPT